MLIFKGVEVLDLSGVDTKWNKINEGKNETATKVINKVDSSITFKILVEFFYYPI